MPAWLLPLVIKFVLPLILQELIKAGVLSDVEAATIKDIGGLVGFVKSLKTYQEFPTGKNGQSG